MTRPRLPPAEFTELLRPHLPALHRLAYRFTGSQADAEDLLQELLTRLYSRAERLADVDVLRPWLARALYHLHVDQCRSRARTPFGHAQELPRDSDESAAAHPQDRGMGPECAAEAALLGQQLAAAVAILPEEQRLIVILHDVEGYELREAASILNVALGTAKSRLHRARERLRIHLRERNLLPANVVSRDEAPRLDLANARFPVTGDEI